MGKLLQGGINETEEVIKKCSPIPQGQVLFRQKQKSPA